MEWSDNGIVVGVRKHGETSVILNLLTRLHGRHLGMVHGGRSRRMRPCLQPGNTVEGVWRARIEDHLGMFTVEPRVLRAGRVMESSAALNAVNHLCALARLLAEREAHAELYDRLEQILDHVDDRRVAPAAIVRFELALLADLGFGLDLDTCASTGSRDDLIYVSPKSGRAVSRIAGDPYRDRMLPLPGFLLDDRLEVAVDDVLAGFRLAEHFLLRDVFLPRGIPMADARNAYVRGLAVPP